MIPARATASEDEPMRISAQVRTVTGSTKHQLATGASGPQQLDPATRVEIVSTEGGFLLIRYGRTGFAGDTWHATAEEAKRQAEIEFGIQPADWRGEPAD